jgi:hypothetical protein
VELDLPHPIDPLDLLQSNEHGPRLTQEAYRSIR